jgi:DNA excision repair protein ERCC-2
VVQAAGRVIRTPTDEGVVHLMDDRYGQDTVQALLPGWWVCGAPRRAGSNATHAGSANT